MVAFYPSQHQVYEPPFPEKPWRINAIISKIPSFPISFEQKEIEEMIKSSGVADLERIREFSNRGEFLREDLHFTPNTYRAALNAVATSIKAGKEKGFGVVRPPGHHASLKAEGFCYFNNIVITTEILYRGKRIAIIDLDSHYGNGTHELIKDKENYFYGSIHADSSQHYPFNRINSKNSLLIDVDPLEVDDREYLKNLDYLLEKVVEFEPELIAISIGFDTWYRDVVLPFNIREKTTYRLIGEKIKALGKPFFALLEGGYSYDIGELAYEFYVGLGYEIKEVKERRELLKIKKEPNKKYFITPFGDVFESKQEIKKISSFEPKPGYKYTIEKDSVVEKRLIKLPLDLFYKYQRDGTLSELFRRGFEVEVDEKDLTYKEYKKLDDDVFSSLEGKCIKKVEIKREKGKKEVILHLSNGKKFIFREGLLVGSREIEVE